MQRELLNQIKILVELRRSGQRWYLTNYARSFLTIIVRRVVRGLELTLINKKNYLEFLGLVYHKYEFIKLLTLANLKEIKSLITSFSIKLKKSKEV